MNIYSPKQDDEFILHLKQWMQDNPFNPSELPKTGNVPELHPLYGKKHTEETKLLMSLSHSGSKNHMYGIRGNQNPNFGRIREDLIDINKSRAGRKVDDSTKEKLRVQRIGEGNPMYGKKHTPESKAKMGRLGKNNPAYGKKYTQEKVGCPYCDVIGGKGQMKRYHGDKCKFRMVIK
jgi:hypothetical protein